MVDFAGLEVVDYLRSGALILAFFATVFADRKGESSTWLITDALTGAAFGAGLYLFPNVLLAYQTTVKNDFLAEFLVRIIGCCLLASSLRMYYLANNKDRTIAASWLMERVIGGLTLFMLMMTAHLKNPRWFKDQHKTFGLLVCGLWTLGNMYHLFRQNNYGSMRRDGLRQGLTNNIMIDALIVAPHCLVMLCFPEMAFPALSMTEFHFFLMRILAVLIMSSRLFAYQSIFFSQDDDKKAFFKGHLWYIVLWAPWAVLLCYQHNVVRCDLYHCSGLVAMIILFINALKGAGCIKYDCGCSVITKFFQGQ